MTSHVVPVTDFRKEAKRFLHRIEETPLVLTQRSRPVAVLVDYEAYRRQEQRLEELELMLDDTLLAHAVETAEEYLSPEELFAAIVPSDEE